MSMRFGMCKVTLEDVEHIKSNDKMMAIIGINILNNTRSVASQYIRKQFKYSVLESKYTVAHIEKIYTWDQWSTFITNIKKTNPEYII